MRDRLMKDQFKITISYLLLGAGALAALAVRSSESFSSYSDQLETAPSGDSAANALSKKIEDPTGKKIQIPTGKSRAELLGFGSS